MSTFNEYDMMTDDDQHSLNHNYSDYMTGSSPSYPNHQFPGHFDDDHDSAIGGHRYVLGGAKNLFKRLTV